MNTRQQQWWVPAISIVYQLEVTTPISGLLPFHFFIGGGGGGVCVNISFIYAQSTVIKIDLPDEST